MKERNSNFELMRIISMLFIILWHIIMHGGMIENCYNQFIRVILRMFQWVLIVHVNSFVLLSGYFQSKSKFRLSKLLELFFQVVFYLNLIFLIAVKFGFIENYTMATIWGNIAPYSIYNYWFIQVYFILYIFSDYINKFIDRLDRREYKNLLILLFLILSIMSFVTGGRFFGNIGYNLYNFVFLYMIGGYLRRYPLRETYHFKRFSKNGYLFLMLFGFFFMAFINFCMFYFVDNVITGDSYLFKDFIERINYSDLSYSTPLVIIQTICYFELFGMVSIKSKLINFVSSCTFGVYLFHDNNIVRGYIYKLLKIDNGFYGGYDMILHMFCVLMFIFLVGFVIEVIRKVIFYLLDKFILIKKIKLFLQRLCDSFNCKITW